MSRDWQQATQNFALGFELGDKMVARNQAQEAARMKWQTIADWKKAENDRRAQHDADYAKLVAGHVALMKQQGDWYAKRGAGGGARVSGGGAPAYSPQDQAFIDRQVAAGYQPPPAVAAPSSTTINMPETPPVTPPMLPPSDTGGSNFSPADMMMFGGASGGIVPDPRAATMRAAAMGVGGTSGPGSGFGVRAAPPSYQRGGVVAHYQRAGVVDPFAAAKESLTAPDQPSPPVPPTPTIQPPAPVGTAPAQQGYGQQGVQVVTDAAGNVWVAGKFIGNFVKEGMASAAQLVMQRLRGNIPQPQVQPPAPVATAAAQLPPPMATPPGAAGGAATTEPDVPYAAPGTTGRRGGGASAATEPDVPYAARTAKRGEGGRRGAVDTGEWKGLRDPTRVEAFNYQKDIADPYNIHYTTETGQVAPWAAADWSNRWNNQNLWGNPAPLQAQPAAAAAPATSQQHGGVVRRPPELWEADPRRDVDPGMQTEPKQGGPVFKAAMGGQVAGPFLTTMERTLGRAPRLPSPRVRFQEGGPVAPDGAAEPTEAISTATPAQGPQPTQPPPTAPAAPAGGMGNDANEMTPIMKAASDFAGHTFHLTQPDEHTVGGYHALMHGHGSPTMGEVDEGFRKIDPNNTMPMHTKMQKLTESLYDYYVARNEPERAGKVAFEAAQFGNTMAKHHAKQAGDLLQAGDMTGAMHQLVAGYNWLPDGHTADYDPRTQTVTLKSGGLVTGTLPVTPQVAENFVHGMMSGELNWDIMRGRGTAASFQQGGMVGAGLAGQILPSGNQQEGGGPYVGEPEDEETEQWGTGAGGYARPPVTKPPAQRRAGRGGPAAPPPPGAHANPYMRPSTEPRRPMDIDRFDEGGRVSESTDVGTAQARTGRSTQALIEQDWEPYMVPKYRGEQFHLKGSPETRDTISPSIQVYPPKKSYQGGGPVDPNQPADVGAGTGIGVGDGTQMAQAVPVTPPYVAPRNFTGTPTEQLRQAQEALDQPSPTQPQQTQAQPQGVAQGDQPQPTQPQQRQPTFNDLLDNLPDITTGGKQPDFQSLKDQATAKHDAELRRIDEDAKTLSRGGKGLANTFIAQANDRYNKALADLQQRQRDWDQRMRDVARDQTQRRRKSGGETGESNLDTKFEKYATDNLGVYADMDPVESTRRIRMMLQSGQAPTAKDETFMTVHASPLRYMETPDKRAPLKDIATRLWELNPGMSEREAMEHTVNFTSSIPGRKPPMPVAREGNLFILQNEAGETTYIDRNTLTQMRNMQIANAADLKRMENDPEAMRAQQRKIAAQGLGQRTINELRKIPVIDPVTANLRATGEIAGALTRH